MWCLLRVASCQIAPPIRFQHGGIQIGVDLLEDGDEALVVDRLFLGGERGAGADGFEHVIHPGEREVRVKHLLFLAMRVELVNGGFC